MKVISPKRESMGSRETNLVLRAVGDIMLGDLPACYGFGVGSVIEKFGPHFPFARISKALAGSDLLLGNLECVLSRRNIIRGFLPSLYMRGDPSCAQALKECGFNILSVANNHTMQHGVAAFRDTVSLLQKAGIQAIGLKSRSASRTIPYIARLKGFSLGFLAYSLRPEEYRPKTVQYSRGDFESVLVGLRRLRDKVDFVIISLHWGDEYVQRPSPEQVDMARRLVDSGADIILGHHPHVPQGVEKYNNGLIAYSLGNFVFDMWMPETRRSILLEIKLNKSGITGFCTIPIRIGGTYQPTVLGGARSKTYDRLIEMLCDCIREKDYGLERYRDGVAFAFGHFRKSVWRHYRKNFLKYNPFYLLELLLLIFLRRIFKIHI